MVEIHRGTPIMANIDYYIFPLSPYAYLAGSKLEKIAEKHRATITYKPVILAKVFERTGGIALADRHESRQKYRLADIARTADAAGLKINPRPMWFPANPVPACAAIISAQKAGGDVGALCRAILRAVWAEERNVAEDAVVKECLSACGFDPALLDRGMLSAVDVLERNTHDAVEIGVFGAPSYVVGTDVFWGQDRLPLLDRFLAKI